MFVLNAAFHLLVPAGGTAGEALIAPNNRPPQSLAAPARGAAELAVRSTMSLAQSSASVRHSSNEKHTLRRSCSNFV